jgi:RNA polymerase sigma-B factor
MLMPAMAAFLPPIPSRPIHFEASTPVAAASVAAAQPAAAAGAPPSLAPTSPAQKTGRASMRARPPGRLRASDPVVRRRNALVEANLPLARAVVARFSPRPPLPHEDLMQVASLGLIRAVEAFDPSRAVSFSSFAVPYIRGALLHELRDRQPMVRIPRPLWELRQQTARLQEERRGRSLPPLDRPSLALRLGCTPERLLEIEDLRAAALPRSLDAPLERGPAGSDVGVLLDRLADPRSLVGDLPEPDGVDPLAAERVWFRQQLAALDPMRRQLVEGRLRLGCTWVELGRQLGIHPRMAQRRCDATMHELKLAAERWQATRHGAEIT